MAEIGLNSALGRLIDKFGRDGPLPPVFCYFLASIILILDVKKATAACRVIISIPFPCVFDIEYPCLRWAFFASILYRCRRRNLKYSVCWSFSSRFCSAVSTETEKVRAFALPLRHVERSGHTAHLFLSNV